MGADAIDGALEQFAAKGPEFGPGLSNHGPMASEALIALGRGDEILRWAEWYAPRLGERPEARNPIAPEDWREALGDIGRAGDWTAFFHRELAGVPWREAIDIWVARLAPGIMAGATHGILRTAHAVRSLEREETPQRIAELANGLAYWAARYQALPEVAGASQGRSVADALAHVRLVDPEAPRAGLIFNVVRVAVERTDFAGVIDEAAIGDDINVFVSDLTGVFVRQYVRNANKAGIAFIHTVTAPGALRILAPYLSEDHRRGAMRYAWQACASIYAAYGREPAPRIDLPEDAARIDREDLIDRAVAARDEHAIKFTEACLREYARRPDPVFLLAARDASARYRSPQG